MRMLLLILTLTLVLTSSVISQSLSARIINARIDGNDFKWDVEINRTDDWGSGGGNDVLGNCDFYFYVNVNGFTSANPTLSNIHSSITGNSNYSFNTGRAGSGSQCYVALIYDSFGGGTNWYPPLDSWELLYTASLPIDDPNVNSGLSWFESSTGFSRGNDQPLTKTLLVEGESDISLPVELISFTAVAGNNEVVLSWRTASELNNLGFIVLRKSEFEQVYEELSTYETNPALQGSGSSSSEHNYSYKDNFVQNNIIYSYKLIDVDINGFRTEHKEIKAVPNNSNFNIINSKKIPEHFVLEQNYPNPFNPNTKIEFGIPDIPEIGTTVIEVYNTSGKKIITLLNKSLNPGFYSIDWTGQNNTGHCVSSGMYIYIIKNKKFVQSKKMILIH